MGKPFPRHPTASIPPQPIDQRQNVKGYPQDFPISPKPRLRSEIPGSPARGQEVELADDRTGELSLPWISPPASTFRLLLEVRIAPAGFRTPIPSPTQDFSGDGGGSGNGDGNGEILKNHTSPLRSAGWLRLLFALLASLGLFLFDLLDLCLFDRFDRSSLTASPGFLNGAFASFVQ